MPGARLLPALLAILIGPGVLVRAAHAQGVSLDRTVFEMPVPGGLRAAMAAIDDAAAADRSQFLLELIRRSHHMPSTVKKNQQDGVRETLLAHLAASGAALHAARETLPLPLPPALWTDVVFGGRASPGTLVGDILRSRGAALLYYGLLSLDDATRAWLAEEPELLADLATKHAPAFVVAAPGLRVAGQAVRVPGGETAAPAWEALVGHSLHEPAGFIRALLAHGEGRLAYFYGAMGQLTQAEVQLALNLDSPDPADRTSAARRLLGVFERLGPGWKIEERTFWRPSLDPALLVADLHTGSSGRPSLPGTREFWTQVFAGVGPGRTMPRHGAAAARQSAEGVPVEFAWLCEQVFTRDHTDQDRRYQAVLFASRRVEQVTGETAEDALETVRAAAAFPALTAALERARLADLASYASAARRAAGLAAIRNQARAVRALAQFQGALVLVTRAALRGSLPAGSVAGHVSSLSDVEVSDRGEYDGRLVRWLDAHLLGPGTATHALLATDDDSTGPFEGAGRAVERDLLRAIAGPEAAAPRFVEWEGTRYRVDLARAETIRLARLLGESRRPSVAAAWALVGMADALDNAGLTAATLREQGETFDRIARTMGWEEPGRPAASPQAYRGVAPALRRVARDGDTRAAPRLGARLRVLADDLLARGLMELAYAAALGQPERIPVSADDAASRHDFGLRSGGMRSAAWQLPVQQTDQVRGWRVTGSLLGLDVRLAEFSLLRLSSKPPARVPTLNERDRRAMIESVALVEAASLTDADRNTIVSAMRRGRERLSAATRPAEAAALADEIGLGAARRTLLPWVVVHEPERVAAFLSPSELLWLGLERRPVGTTLHAWGAPGLARLGCLCLQLMVRRPWEALAGRWHSGILASGFPELNLRLTELLAELQMPAPLLAPVLAPATLDFVETVRSRDQDDRRGLVEFVQNLHAERVEEYLALLTTDGPLVPSDEAADAAGACDGAGPEVP